MNEYEPKQDPLPQHTVVDGRYLLQQCIGRGGFAWVYRARHVDLGRVAAVKVLDVPAKVDQHDFVQRFLREARIIARLNHPNIVSVYDFGVHEPTGQAYIAMELLEGRDLEDELMTFGALEPVRAQRLFGGICAALGEAHAAGVVHKDLKPSNLFIVRPGQPDEQMVLLDFGVAWAADEGARLTQAGAFTGTPAYVAPEYATHHEVSPRVDVYQLGLLLSEALSGVPCVAGTSSVRAIVAHCNGEITIPDAVRSSGFGPLIERATQLEPQLRFEDAAVFGDALRDVDPTTLESLTRLGARGALTAEYVLARAIETEMSTPFEAATEQTSRSKLAIGLLLLGVVLGAFVVVAALQDDEATPSPTAAAPPVELRTPPAEETVLAAQPPSIAEWAGPPQKESSGADAVRHDAGATTMAFEGNDVDAGELETGAEKEAEIRLSRERSPRPTRRAKKRAKRPAKKTSEPETTPKFLPVE